jgi:hypothetical protein
MRALIYTGSALWICIGVFLSFWLLIVGTQAMSNRLFKPGASLIVFPSSDPADYNELGQRYLKKKKRVFLLFMAYLFMSFILVANLMWFWDELPR